MTATPLFDAIARRTDRSVVPPIVPAGYRAAAPSRTAFAEGAVLAPSLIAAIDAIPAAVRCPDARHFDAAASDDRILLSADDIATVSAVGDAVIRRMVEVIDQELDGLGRRRAVVEALGDRLTQLAVDAVADELDRIDRDRAIARG